MALCPRSSSDPLLRELLDKGINLVLPPRDDLSPGDLVIAEKDGKARHAKWSSVLAVDPSRISVARTAPISFDLKVSGHLEAGLAARLAGSILSALGLTDASLSGVLAKAGCQRVSLKLVAPAVTALEDFDGLLEQLRAADAEVMPAYQGLRLFVIQAAWRAKGLRLAMFGDRDQRLTLTGEAEQLLAAELALSLKRDAAGSAEFTAASPLIFGIEMRELTFAGGLIADKAQRAHLKFRSPSDRPILLETEEDSAFVDLGEAA